MRQTKMIKAIALLSGGLDSILASKLILEQGIEVEAVNFLTVFCTCTSRGRSCLASKSAADSLGVKLKVFEVSREYFEIIKKPKYGYGSGLNPCLDCRIFMFNKAGQYMKEAGANFLFTGEVLGERPMSQRKEAMKIIERDSGLEGLILRPLSAQLLEPTIPEKKGLVDRRRLFNIQGRSRRPQIKLAKQLGINDYPCPAGGCLLTDKGFSMRMRDLMRHKLDFTANDVRLLKVGRHFRMDKGTKLIVGRNEEENNELLKLANRDDCCFYPIKIKGPVGITRGDINGDYVRTASSILARYCDRDSSKKVEIGYKRFNEDMFNTAMFVPMREQDLKALRI